MTLRAVAVVLFLRTLRQELCGAASSFFVRLLLLYNTVYGPVMNVKYGKFYSNFGLLIFHVMLAAVR